MTDPRRLTTQQAADRLGVKPETVYAYVSRGILHSEREAAGRGSTFDRDEIDTLLDRGRRVRPQLAGARTWRGPVVDSDITMIADGRLYLRGVDAVELSRALGFEAVASWLWTGDTDTQPFVPPAPSLACATAAVRALPDTTDLVSRLRVAVAAAAAADPLRYDVRGGVVATARGLVATMVEALPVRGSSAKAASSSPSRSPSGGRQPSVVPPLPRRLWARLTPRRPTDRMLDSLDAALVLLIDHDLAVSTVAARVAASTRAHPYAVVSTGLSAMEGPLHGGASSLAFTMLAEARERGARSVVAEHLRSGRDLPGFGHSLYPDGDPRAAALRDRLAGERSADAVLDTVAQLADASRQQPNIDLLLAALAQASGMDRTAGEVVFAVARSVGWIAHALEEYDESPLRFRGQGRYRGPQPPQPLPRGSRER
jgi:citrate synthase